MKSLNQYNQSSRDLYKSEESTLDKVIGAVAFIAFILIVSFS